MTTNPDNPCRVLIVEDEAIVAIDIEQQLESLGYDVVAMASTADAACEAAARLLPDLVLMDIHLDAGSDGIEAAERIRRELGIPTIFLTAYADEGTLLRAKLAEPYGYLVKPFDSRDLHTTLQVAFHKGQVDRALRQSRDDLAAILDAQRHGTVMIDADETVTLLSRAAGEMLGASADAAIGQPWTDVLHLETDQQERLAAEMRSPQADRNKLSIALSDSAEGAATLEIEIRDDPRDDARRVLFLYDVSQEVQLRQMLDQQALVGEMIGKSKPMQHVFQLIGEIAQVDSTAIIEGETGTGKELVARAIHQASRRADKPLVALNCGGLNEELAMSQLFGHKRGAFTGAVTDQVGIFEAAHGGTLFLDEIGELPMRVQTMLLRVLEEREITRVGESQSQKIDVRILAATNRPLAAEVEAGRFRADLLYRIRIARVDLPPLRERREDIPLLARRFLGQHGATTGKRVTAISDGSMSVLIAHTWPGNVRELKNALEYAVIRAKSPIIQPEDLPPEVLEMAGQAGLLEDFTGDERGRILAALKRTGGNRKEAAEMLGMSRATFYRRLSQLDIDADK